MILVYDNQTGLVNYVCSEPDDLSLVDTMLNPNQAYHVVPDDADTSQFVANADGVVEVGDYPEFATAYDFDNNSWVIDTDTETQSKWNAMRSNRATLLKDSDWTQVPDSPLSDEKKAEWATYRQELRDLPDNITDINNITWPAQPQ